MVFFFKLEIVLKKSSMIARFDVWYNTIYEMTWLMIQIDIRVSLSNMIWHDTAHNADSGTNL